MRARLLRDTWSQLVCLSPGLTTLQLHADIGSRTHFELGATDDDALKLPIPLVTLSHLRELHLVDAKFLALHFDWCFASPALAQLEVLTLSNPIVRLRPPLRVAFAKSKDTLLRLHTLHLRSLRDQCVNWIVQGAAISRHCDSSRFCHSQVSNPLAGPVLPHPMDLCEMVSRRPAVSVVIYRSFPRDQDEEPMSPLDQLRAAYPACADEIGKHAALLLQLV